MIGEHIRAIAIEHEEVAMAAEGETGAGLRSQRLLYAGEPGLRVLPGIEVAVELVRPERMIHVRQIERAVAEVGRQTRDGGELQIAIVAVGLETGRKIASE